MFNKNEYIVTPIHARVDTPKQSSINVDGSSTTRLPLSMYTSGSAAPLKNRVNAPKKNDMYMNFIIASYRSSFDGYLFSQSGNLLQSFSN